MPFTTLTQECSCASLRGRARLVAGVMIVLVAIVAPLGASAGLAGTNVLVESAAAQATVVATGLFYGVDELHYGSGSATVSETAPGQFVVDLNVYGVAPGPDLLIYLSPSATGYAEGAIELGALTAAEGAFRYAVPSGIDPRAYGSVIIWCRQFAVLFATAPLAVA